LTDPFAYDVAERLLYCRLEQFAQTGT
jgi:hypothetical protein